MQARSAVIAVVASGMMSSALASSDVLWLSDAFPKSAKASREVPHASMGKHSDSVDAAITGDEGNDLHGSTKRLWLRQGDDPANAAYVETTGTSATIDLLDAKGKRSQMAMASANGIAQAKVEFSDLGFYNAYLTRESVINGTKRVQLAKAELLKGSCCMKTGDVDPDQMRAIRNPDLPLEIVREHEPDEKLFTRIVSGDNLRFTILRQGKPAAGVAVTMSTQQGWQKKAVSNENGMAEFTMIRDYFPAWSDFKRRTKESFLVIASVEDPASGEADGQPYSRITYEATLSGRYAPSPYDYKSYAWGLGVSLSVFAFGGLSVYLYRRRRLRPFKEVRFNEVA